MSEVVKVEVNDPDDAASAPAPAASPACKCECESCRITKLSSRHLALSADAENNDDDDNANSGSRKRTIHDVGDYIELFEETSHSAWPTTCNEPCRWCLYRFENTFPIGIPVRYDEVRCRMVMRGYFCSFACAAAYVYDQHRNAPTLNLGWLQIFAKRCFGLERIRAAPPREMLGWLSIEQFRSLSEEAASYAPVYNARFYEREHEFYEKSSDRVSTKRRYAAEGATSGFYGNSSNSSCSVGGGGGGGGEESHEYAVPRSQSKGLKPPPSVSAAETKARSKGVLAMLGATMKKKPL